MGGRPWGPIKTRDPVVRSVVTWLRGLVTGSEVTVRDLAERCGCKPSTVSKRLSGAEMPTQAFVDQVIEACTPRPAWPMRKKQARDLMARPRTEASRTAVVIDAHSRVVESQRETIAAQRQLIESADELSRARLQLMESTRLELRAAQMIAVLRIVLLQLAGAVSELSEERALTRASLDRAKSERDRATALADAALELIATLGERVGGVELPVEVPVITSDEVMVDLRAGLQRVQRILDDQNDALNRLESEALPATEAERLLAQYEDAPMDVAILDSDGRFLQVNRRFLGSFGYSAEDLGRMRLSDIAKPWSRDGDDEHLVLTASESVDWYLIRRWTVSKCQIAVFEEDWARASTNWEYPDTFLPDNGWLKMWCADYMCFGTGQVNACQVDFDLDAVEIPDGQWHDYQLSFVRRLFSLMAPGRVLVQLGDGTFLFVTDGGAAGIDEVVDDLGPALVEAAEGVPFTLDVAECRGTGSGFDAEILHNIETAALWAATFGRTQQWTVREPDFGVAIHETVHDGSLLYQPLVSKGGHQWDWGVRVTDPISPAVFRKAVEQLEQWYADSLHLFMEFVVTQEELRLHDWRTEFRKYSSVERYVSLMLDGDPDFTDYVLLRRFGRQARAGVVSADERVLRRAHQLRLHTPTPIVPAGDPVEAAAVAAWVTKLNKERSRRRLDEALRRT